MRTGIEYLKTEINMTVKDNDIDDIFKAMDFDNSGQVDYTEFIASFLDSSVFRN